MLRHFRPPGRHDIFLCRRHDQRHVSDMSPTRHDMSAHEGSGRHFRWRHSLLSHHVTPYHNPAPNDDYCAIIMSRRTITPHQMMITAPVLRQPLPNRHRSRSLIYVGRGLLPCWSAVGTWSHKILAIGHNKAVTYVLRDQPKRRCLKMTPQIPTTYDYDISTESEERDYYVYNISNKCL